MAITAFLSRSPGLLNRGPGDPASLGHVPHSSIFFPTGLISNCSIGGLRAPSAGCWFSLLHLNSNCLISNSSDFLSSPGLYNCSTPAFFLWVSQIALNSTCPQSRLYPDIPWPDAPFIYTGAFPILTAWLGSICYTMCCIAMTMIKLYKHIIYIRMHTES